MNRIIWLISCNGLVNTKVVLLRLFALGVRFVPINSPNYVYLF